jgi:ribonuclease-3
VTRQGYEILEGKIGYRFKDQKVLENALVHKSYVNENASAGLTNNQRLEFLGDAVLDLVISHLLMEKFPKLHEGELSMTRAEMVSEGAVADVAAGIALGEWLFLGRGEENTGGRHKPSLLADALEAMIAAVYLDGGFSAAFDVVSKLFVPRIAAIEEPPGFTDFKTRLQERAQALRKQTPRYEVTAERGPDHNKLFEVMVSIGGRIYSRQGGKSKKEAEQRAAAAALFLIEAEIFDPKHPPPPDDDKSRG